MKYETWMEKEKSKQKSNDSNDVDRRFTERS
jgi:hypothetical protein